MKMGKWGNGRCAMCFSVGNSYPSFSRKLSPADLLKADSNES